LSSFSALKSSLFINYDHFLGILMSGVLKSSSNIKMVLDVKYYEKKIRTLHEVISDFAAEEESGDRGIIVSSLMEFVACTGEALKLSEAELEKGFEDWLSDKDTEASRRIYLFPEVITSEQRDGLVPYKEHETIKHFLKEAGCASLAQVCARLAIEIHIKNLKHFMAGGFLYVSEDHYSALEEAVLSSSELATYFSIKPSFSAEIPKHTNELMYQELKKHVSSHSDGFVVLRNFFDSFQNAIENSSTEVRDTLRAFWAPLYGEYCKEDKLLVASSSSSSSSSSTSTVEEREEKTERKTSFTSLSVLAAPPPVKSDKETDKIGHVSSPSSP
jgi:hypothetical protein